MNSRKVGPPTPTHKHIRHLTGLLNLNTKGKDTEVLNVGDLLCFNSSSRITAVLCALIDLDELIQHGDLTNLTSPAQINSTKSPTARSQPSPPAYTKEKGGGLSLTVGRSLYFTTF